MNNTDDLHLSEADINLLNQLSRFHQIQPIPDDCAPKFYRTMGHLLLNGKSLDELLSAYKKGISEGHFRALFDVSVISQMRLNDIENIPNDLNKLTINDESDDLLKYYYARIKGILKNSPNVSLSSFIGPSAEEIPSVFLNDWEKIKPYIVQDN